VMAGLLYETSASDPWLLSAVTAVFVLVALGASLVPAWRASRVKPMVSMRTEHSSLLAVYNCGHQTPNVKITPKANIGFCLLGV
jgi:hypothetical protein